MIRVLILPFSLMFFVTLRKLVNLSYSVFPEVKKLCYPGAQIEKPSVRALGGIKCELIKVV